MESGGQNLADLTWPEVEARGSEMTLLVPVGSTEQHGPHLPLDTDTRIAMAIAVGATESSPDLLVAPAITYAASGEHQDFPGTLSIGTEVLTDALVELTRSAGSTFRAVVFVNGHGGNFHALTEALQVARREGRVVATFTPTHPPISPVEPDAHAGVIETSIMLAVAPGVVRMDLAEAGNTIPLANLLPELQRDGLAPHAPNGVLGDPSQASPELGRDLLVVAVADLLSAVDALHRAAEPPTGEP